MRSLKKLNAAAGTAFTRWEQVVESLEAAVVLKRFYGQSGMPFTDKLAVVKEKP